MKKLSIEKLGILSIAYREHILLANVVEKTSNGVWIESLCGERNFIPRSEIVLMLDFVSKCL